MLDWRGKGRRGGEVERIRKRVKIVSYLLPAHTRARTRTETNDFVVVVGKVSGFTGHKLGEVRWTLSSSRGMPPLYCVTTLSRTLVSADNEATAENYDLAADVVWERVKTLATWAVVSLLSFFFFHHLFSSTVIRLWPKKVLQQYPISVT